jgi:hypothetical protein
MAVLGYIGNLSKLPGDLRYLKNHGGLRIHRKFKEIAGGDLRYLKNHGGFRIHREFKKIAGKRIVLNFRGI